MKLLSLKTDRIIRLVVAVLFGLSLGVIVWMFTLPSGFISKWRLVYSAVLAVLFAFLYYRFLLPCFIHKHKEFNFRWGIIGIVLALLIGIVFQKVITQQSLIFPFMPKQTLTLTLQSDSLSFRPVECELKTLYSKDFIVSGDLQRIDSGLMILRGYGSTLTWKGWPGSTCVFTTDIEPLNVFQLTWGTERTTAIGRLSNNPEEYSWTLTFPVPILTKLIVAIILIFVSLAVFLALVCGYMALSTNKSSVQEQSSIVIPKKGFTYILLIVCGLLALVLFLRFLFSINPITEFPSRDSGVFLDIGKRVLAGETPYLDYWDHKGPLVYFINAIGKLIDPVGEWGIFSLQVGFIGLTAFLIRRFLVRNLSWLSFGIGLCVFFYFLYSLGQGGNLVEIYSLLFITMGLITGIKAIESGRNWQLLVLGSSAALAFTLRPNLIAVFIVSFTAWLIDGLRRKRPVLKGILLTISGALLILVPLVLFFVSRHAMKDLLDQVFLYNFLYSESTHINLWEKLTRYYIYTLPVILLGLFGLLFTVGIQLKKPWISHHFMLLKILTYSFLLEMIFSQISGFDFPHYSLPLMLMGTMITMLFFDGFYSAMNPGNRKFGLNLILFLAMAGLSTRFIVEISTYDFTPRKFYIDPEVMQMYIEPQPSILVWGAESTFHYLVDIPSPTRYVYQYSLVRDEYCTEGKGDEFLQAIEETMPMIIDASISNTWMPPLPPDIDLDGPQKTVTFGSMQCLQEFFDFFETHYELVYQIPGNRWLIYMPIGTAPIDK